MVILVQSDLAITDLVIPGTLLYRTLCNPNGARRLISPCYNEHTTHNGPDRFFEI